MLGTQGWVVLLGCLVLLTQRRPQRNDAKGAADFAVASPSLTSSTSASIGAETARLTQSGVRQEAGKE